MTLILVGLTFVLLGAGALLLLAGRREAIGVFSMHKERGSRQDKFLVDLMENYQNPKFSIVAGRVTTSFLESRGSGFSRENNLYGLNESFEFTLQFDKFKADFICDKDSEGRRAALDFLTPCCGGFFQLVESFAPAVEIPKAMLEKEHALGASYFYCSTCSGNPLAFRDYKVGLRQARRDGIKPNQIIFEWLELVSNAGPLANALEAEEILESLEEFLTHISKAQESANLVDSQLTFM